MFRRIELRNESQGLRAPQEAASISFEFEGRMLQAQPGQMLATALLQAGERVFRETPVSGEPRGPLCLMGVCFECLVEIDGRPNQQACMLTVQAGMKVRRQRGARS